MAEYGVEFGNDKTGENQSSLANRVKNKKSISITERVMKLPFMHTEKRASYFLIALSAIFFIAALSLMLYYGFGVGRERPFKYYGASQQTTP